jgi:NTP pyrophosphatase (non-canonical NTP hydrolase)
MTAPSKVTTLVELRNALRVFAAEREWDQFHTPKNLAVAISVEAGELLERFQWLSDDQATKLDREQLAKLQEEVADVLLYLVRLADKLNIDLLDAAARKIELNAQKYPIAKARGNMKKYTDL